MNEEDKFRMNVSSYNYEVVSRAIKVEATEEETICKGTSIRAIIGEVQCQAAK